MRPTCGNDSVCNGKNLCNKKNIVYKLTCKQCRESYIGETHRTVITRIKEHLRRKESEFYRHFKAKHNTDPTLEQTDWIILASNFESTNHRKQAEMLYIHKESPSINRHHASDQAATPSRQQPLQTN